MPTSADISEIDRIVLHQLQEENGEFSVQALYEKVFPCLRDLDRRIGRPDLVASIWRLVDAGSAELSADRKVRARQRQAV